MLNVSSLLGLFILFLNMNVFASECTQQSFNESFTCEKTFRAKSLSDIERYKSEEVLSKKNLLIYFDLVNDQSLEIHTPCMVRFHKDFNINTTGDLCIDARDGIRLHYGKTITANDITLYSKNRIAIQREATINVNNLTMISNGDTLESRVHIRHSSVVNANNLFLSGYEMATLGHSSQYQVANTLTLNSDKLAHFRKNSTYTAQNFVSEARDCKVTGVETTSTSGCFNPSRPTARFRAVEREINTGDSLSFKMDRSLPPNGLSEYVFLVNGVEYQRGTDFNFDFDFNEPGTFYVKGEVIDSLGLVSSVQRKITVTDKVEKDFNAQFVHNIDGDELNLFFMQNMPLDQYQSGVLTINGEVTNLQNFYHRSLMKTISGAGIYNVSLVVTNIYGQSYSFDKIIEVGDEEFNANVNPIVDINLYNTGYKNVFVDVTGAFDPSGEYQSIIIDWGDDTSEEFEFQEVIGVKHEYATSGLYEVSVSVIKEGSDDKQIVETEIREIQVTNDEVSQIAPVVDYLTYQEDFAAHVIFNVHLAASPNSEISSVVLDYGDGSSSQVLEKTVDTHFYEPGIYFPKLIVTDANGLQTIKESRVTIVESGPPTVSEVLCESEGLDIECDLIAIDKLRQLESLEINWGDGTSDTIQIEDSISEEFYWEGIEHRYSEAGIYTLTFNVNTIRGETVSKDFTYEIESGDSGEGGNDGGSEEVYLEAVLNCYSHVVGGLVCDASSSYYSAGYIANYIFTVNGVQYFGDYIEINNLESSIADVELKVITNDMQEAFSVGAFDIQAVEPLVALINCTEVDRLYICSASIGGGLPPFSLEWNIPNTGIINEELARFSLRKGENLISLSIQDNDGSVLTKTHSIYVENTLPDALLNCSEVDAFIYKCNAEVSDVDGDPISLKWIFKNEVIGSKDNVMFYSGTRPQELELLVSDGEDERSYNLTIDPGSVSYIPVISCETEMAGIARCEETGNISSYVENPIFKWTLDGETIESRSFNFSVQDGVVYSLKLDIYDGELLIASAEEEVSGEFYITEDNSSAGDIQELTLNDSNLNEGAVELQVSGTDLVVNEDGEIQNITIMLNSNYIQATKITYDQTLKIIRFKPDKFYYDRLNKIEMSTVDIDGKVLSFEKDFLVGNSVREIVNDYANISKIKLCSVVNSSVCIERVPIDGKLYNIPNLNLVANITMLNFSEIAAVLPKDKSLSFSSVYNETPLYSRTDIVNPGSWVISTGEAFLENNNEDSISTALNSLDTISFSGEQISSYIRIKNDLNNDYLELPFSFSSQSSSSYIFIKVTNETTNESYSIIQRGSDSKSTINSYLREGINVGASNEDILLIELNAYFLDEAMIPYTFLRGIVQNVFANDFQENLLQIDPVKSEGLIQSFKILDGVKTNKGKMLRNIAGGDFPEKYSVTSVGSDSNPSKKVFRYLLEVKTEENINFDNHEVKIHFCPSTQFYGLVSQLDSCTEFDAQNILLQPKADGKNIFEYTPQQFDPQDNYYKVCISVTNRESSLIEDFDCSKTDKMESDFRSLVDISGEFDNRYYSQTTGAWVDAPQGGDSWISLSHRKWYREFLQTLRENQGLYNDVNSLGYVGGNRCELGHKSHDDGNKIDIAFSYLTANTGGNVWENASLNNIKSVLNVIDKDIEKIEEIIISDESLKTWDELTPDFASKMNTVSSVNTTCFKDGRRASNIFKHDPKHINHMDIRLFDFDKNGNKIMKSEKRYEAFNFPSDLSLSIEANLGYTISNSSDEDMSYEVYGMTGLDGNYSAPYKLPSIATEKYPFYFENGVIKLNTTKGYLDIFHDAVYKIRIVAVNNVSGNEYCINNDFEIHTYPVPDLIESAPDLKNESIDKNTVKHYQIDRELLGEYGIALFDLISDSDLKYYVSYSNEVLENDISPDETYYGLLYTNFETTKLVSRYNTYSNVLLGAGYSKVYLTVINDTDKDASFAFNISKFKYYKVKEDSLYHVSFSIDKIDYPIDQEPFYLYRFKSVSESSENIDNMFVKKNILLEDLSFMPYRYRSDLDNPYFTSTEEFLYPDILSVYEEKVLPWVRKTITTVDYSELTPLRVDFKEYLYSYDNQAYMRLDKYPKSSVGFSNPGIGCNDLETSYLRHGVRYEVYNTVNEEQAIELLNQNGYFDYVNDPNCSLPQ